MKNNNHYHLNSHIKNKFDKIGSYFLDLYCNNWYKTANKIFKQKQFEKDFENLEEAYEFILLKYLDVAEKDASFLQSSLKGMQQFFILTTSSINKISTMTDLIDNIVIDFIPETYYDNVSDEKKRQVLKKIWLKLIN